MKTALHTSERILFKTVGLLGECFEDPMLTRGATYADVIKAAGDHDAVSIYRFDTDAGQVTDITEDVALHFQGDVTDNPPLWIRDTASFGNIIAAERLNCRQLRTHERSFSHASNFL